MEATGTNDHNYDGLPKILTPQELARLNQLAGHAAIERVEKSVELGRLCKDVGGDANALGTTDDADVAGGGAGQTGKSTAPKRSRPFLSSQKPWDDATGFFLFLARANATPV
jgi:hypothetical protein